MRRSKTMIEQPRMTIGRRLRAMALIGIQIYIIFSSMYTNDFIGWYLSLWPLSKFDHVTDRVPFLESLECFS